MKLTRMITLGLALIGAMSVQPIKAADKVPGVGVQPDTYFYTGKPYDADLGSYIFAYRDYNPQLNRWTTADPSGFPDGVNNRIYAPVPTVQVDPTGEVVASKSFNNQAYSISLSLYIYDAGSGVGPFIDLQKAQHWGSAIQSTWNHTGTDKSNGQVLAFNMSVDVHYFQGPYHLSQTPSNANSVIVEGSNFRSLVYADQNQGQGRWARNNSDLIVSHEAGHMMGAPDMYRDVNGVSQPYNDATHGDWQHTLRGAGETPITKDWNLVLRAMGYSQHLFE